MIRKLLSVAALAAIATTPAFAASPAAGFEADAAPFLFTSGGTVTTATAGPIVIFDDTYGDFATPYNVTPQYGANFGLLTPTYPTPSAASSMTTFSLSSPTTAAGDILWVRLFSAEFDAVNHNDYFTVTFSNNVAPANTFSWSISDTLTYTYGNPPSPAIAQDSGWLNLSSVMPVGTNSIVFNVYNVSADGGNMPIVAVDYTPAAAVPEAGALSMMLAGLGVLGVAARRRSKRTA